MFLIRSLISQDKPKLTTKNDNWSLVLNISMKHILAVGLHRFSRQKSIFLSQRYYIVIRTYILDKLRISLQMTRIDIS